MSRRGRGSRGVFADAGRAPKAPVLRAPRSLVVLIVAGAFAACGSSASPRPPSRRSAT